MALQERSGDVLACDQFAKHLSYPAHAQTCSADYLDGLATFKREQKNINKSQACFAALACAQQEFPHKN
eukprot:4853880-Amphidinium_carterae.1